MSKSFTHSGFAKKTIGVLVLLLAALLIVSTVPGAVTDSISSVAYADTVTYTPSSSDTVQSINSALAAYPAGTVVNMILTNDIEMHDTYQENYSAVEYGIIVPAGLTVNLYMNSHRIVWNNKYGEDNAGTWQHPGMYLMTNRGTLNVYSGSGPNSPNASTASEDRSAFYIYNNRINMKAESANEECYFESACIRNESTLTVNKNVSLYDYSYMRYTDNGNSCEGSVSIGSTGVYQTSTAASVVLNTVNVNVSAKSEGWTSAARRGHSRAYAYGVYGGNVTVNGASEFNLTGYTYAHTSSISSGDHTARNNTVVFGIATTGHVEVYGGNFTYSGQANCDGSGNKMACNSGNQRVFVGGIITNTGNLPVIVDGTFLKMNDNQIPNSVGSLTVREGTVMSASEIPKSGYDFLQTVKGYSRSDEDYPTADMVAGKYYDEVNNVYVCDIITQNGSHPISIIDGAPEDTYRVHVIYRYWLEQNKTHIDTSVVGTTGLVGYSYLPINDGTNIVSTKVQLDGLTSSTRYSKTASAGITYRTGGAVVNSNYYTFFNIAWATPAGEFSDMDFTSSSNKGIAFYNVSSAAGSTVAADVTAPVYVFVDYYRISSAVIKGNVGTNNVVSTTYTGSPILASDLNLKVTNSTGSKDYTADYDINNNNAAKIPVAYTYSGTNAAGEAESGTGLPTNAGTYNVTMHIDDQTEYNRDPNLYKNRKGLDYQFQLTINPAKATRGSLPESVSTVYGTRLSSILPFATYTAYGVNGEGAQNGTFTFSIASDGTSYKNVGTGNVQVTWTPAASVTNYEQTTFTVGYTVTKASLSITPNAATVTYGETVFTTPFSVNLDGLTGNDNTDAVKEAITNSLSFMINKGGAWVAYTPDQAGAGTYPIRATFEGQLPAVMANYEYTYVFGTDANPYGNLTVNARGLTVKATAVSREYAADSYAVNVTFAIESGRYGVDDISVATTVGSVANNNVGTRAVSGIDKAKVTAALTGGAASNYVIDEVTYASGTTLLVEITKATPVVSTPTTDDRYYQMGATLADVTINSAVSSVEGTWQWVDAGINPTVNTKTYLAKFVPNDSNNYNEKTVEVTLNVKPTPVIISYTKTVSYGDKKPNITDFTYSVAQDPTFDFEKLDCEGNISVSTTYEQGSPVSSTGYPVNITATNYTDKGGNYTFTVRNGVIYVSKRTVTFTVQPVTITYGSNFVLNNSTVSVVADENDLYGSDTVNSVTATGDAPTFTFTSDYSAQTNYGAGTYNISAHNNFTTSANYDVEFVDGTLTINKAELVISAKPMTVEYNTEISDATLASAYTVTGAKKNETLAQMMTEGTIGVDTTYYKGAAVNAEGYPVTIDVTECKFPNYNVVVNNSVITVVKATPVITELPTASLVHNQTLSQAVFTGGVVEDGIAGTFVYNSDVAVVYSSSAYTYPATFVPADTANYNTVAIPALTLYVSKLPVTGELAIAGIPMTGETLTVDVSGLDPDEIGVYTFTWKVGDTTIATGTSYTLDSTYVDEYITVYAVANGYYEGTKTAVTSKITPRLTSIETILGADVYANYFTLSGLDAYKGTTTVQYDGREHIASFALANSALSTTSVGAVTVKYNGSTTAPTAAGYYTVSIDVGTPAYTSIEQRDGKSYDPASGKYVYSSISGYTIGTLYISPRDYTVTLTFNDKVYDGTRTATATYTETGACVLTGGAKDDVAYNTAGAAYAFTDANVGNGKTVNVTGASLTGTAAANYNLVIVKAGAGTAAITPATLRVAVEPISREYEKDNYTVYLGFTVDASSLAATDNATQVYVDDSVAYGVIDNCGAGTRLVTVYDTSLAGSKAGNYVLELTNATNLTVEITKATPSYPIPSAGVVYYDSARALNEISLGYDNWQWEDSVKNIVPTAGTHTYKAVFTPNDTENEATVEYNVKLVVNKAPVTIKIASFGNVVYGDNVPTYYYTVTGLTGTDTIKKNVDGYILLDSNYTAGSPVGTYAIVRSGEFESDNYTFSYVSGSITVNPRTVYTTAEAVARPYEQGNTSVDVTFSALSNIFSGDAASVYLSSASTTGTVANDTAGTKKVTYTTPTLAGDKAGNYTLYVNNSNLTVEIEKAVIADIAFPASGTVTYGQKLSSTVFDEPYDAKGLGKFTMENPSATPTATGIFNTGYNVVFTPTDSVNYATVTKTIRLTVNTAVLSGVAVQVSGTTQVGKTLYATVGNVPAAAAPYVTYQWYRVDNAGADYREGYMFASGVDSVTLTESEQGKYIIVVATETENSPYDINGEARTDESIQAETLTFWQRLIKWLYKIMSGLGQLFGRI